MSADAFDEAVAACRRGDHILALGLFRKSADQGHAEAQYDLGLAYINGRGTTKSDVEGAKWFRIAADQGYADAQYMLGWMYADAENVQKDNVQAHMWLTLAAAQGVERAVETLPRVIKRMTSVQIAEAQNLAREWKPTT